MSYLGTEARYKDIDIITIRENTEGMYSGYNQTLSEDGMHGETVSAMTCANCERVVRFAYELARKKRKKVAAIHKANILKTTSSLFLNIANIAREIGEEYPDIISSDIIVDNCCMQLVMNPYQFDVFVTTNLFGDIVSDLCAGLVSGLGMAPGSNIGENAALFEAVHRSAPDIAGKNLANPTALMLAATLMLDHLNMADKAERIHNAIRTVIASHDRGNGNTTRLLPKR